jgi:hypothetical protein
VDECHFSIRSQRRGSALTYFEGCIVTTNHFDQVYIDGQWVSSDSAESIAVVLADSFRELKVQYHLKTVINVAHWPLPSAPTALTVRQDATGEARVGAAR